MESNKGIVALLVFVIILAVVGITFVARSEGSPRRPAEVVPPPLPALGALETKPVEAPVDAPKAPADPPVVPPTQEAKAGDSPEPAQEAEKQEHDPRLSVPPIDEPDMVIDARVADRPDFIAPMQGGGYIFERRDTDGKRIGGVVVPGYVLVTRGMVELFGCGDGGKEHETIVRLEVGVQSLDLALTSAGLKRGNLPAKTDLSLPDQGSRVIILIQWLDKEGKLVTHRSEDLVVSVRRGGLMPRVGWTYVGHWMEVPDPTSPKGEKKHKVLAAANTRSYVTTFRDRSALLDNPLEEAVDDTVFAANTQLLPRSETQVRVIFRSATAAERKEIVVLERDIAKQKIEFKEDDREHEVNPKEKKK